MKNSTLFFVVLSAVLLVMGCDQKLDLQGPHDLALLEVSITVNPEIIPVTYGAGLYARITGAELPLQTAEWRYEGHFLSNAEAVTFVPQETGDYRFSFRVKDAVGRDTTVFATLNAIPLDSI
ncbi:MAG: hypothetical protein COT25_01645 [Candidatus Kerfeldbacteria bacterium CG08_land_8_20_14_0_20_42_7]|uniref:Uncharacterized protein n=1 Tax=Candidatus Kerfeldbacteria bacterium CG08_land_8_20_14_0_20_42_7 TaxID=2014245 RepID=A0A2H0YT97_9BACT|nr:MAG: hypothetical protein COT25_01645 [Candidatus Kerfeldbacteria bacterium CG08_land_8_20_14_0_20_42_7]